MPQARGPALRGGTGHGFTQCGGWIKGGGGAGGAGRGRITRPAGEGARGLGFRF
jgi:hypothetical protein